MRASRRNFLQIGASSLATALSPFSSDFKFKDGSTESANRRFHFVQIDVFSSKLLKGNKLPVFTDARGLTDQGMLGIASEMNVEETTFVFPRDAAAEREQGVEVRIFVPGAELPFAGHPTLGTAMVLRNRWIAAGRALKGDTQLPAEISLKLKVGKISVEFRKDDSGEAFGEMHQVDPVFGRTHDRATVAGFLGIDADEISSEWPIQTVSTGLPFVIVPIKRLKVLQSLQPDHRKVQSYNSQEPGLSGFYYVCQETQDPEIGLRARGLFPEGEDAATGSAAGCTVSWLVRYGIVPPERATRILQGAEINRHSYISVRASKSGDKVTGVRVGGNAVEVLEGTLTL
jgi:trans-2,3-dihydro-3-hydroxyanthranilate isomerase